MTRVAKKLGVHVDSVNNVLNDLNIPKFTDYQDIKDNGVSVKMYNMQGKLLGTFPTIGMAARYAGENNDRDMSSKTYKAHISQVCSGKRKSCGGFKWEYVD